MKSFGSQGFEPIPVAQSIVDMDLTFRKYKMRALSTSLGRAKVGALYCASPAIVGDKIFMRTSASVSCYQFQPSK